MSSFVALNIEPDEDIEEEVDDTKEIQIEEALKLYQNALKLHSQGPAFFSQAKEAYAALFTSEIFKYPESISDYRRAALQDAAAQELGYADEAVPDTLAELDANDAAASALPQTIYLSYKNRAQFVLDSLREAIRADPTCDGDRQRILTDVRSAMEMFAEALERDDTDLDLWRKSARLGSALNSYRLSRYCLESVLVGDDNELEYRPEQLGLEEAFATEDLQRIYDMLRDQLAALLAPPLKKPRKTLFRFLKHQIDPYQFLPALSEDLHSKDTKHEPSGAPASRHTVEVSEYSWAAVGRDILKLVMAEEQDGSVLEPGATLTISVPEGYNNTVADEDEAVEEAAKTRDTADHVSMGDVEMEEKAGSADNAKSPRNESAPVEGSEDRNAIDERAESQLRESLEGLSKQQQLDDGFGDGKPDQDNDINMLESTSRKRSSASLGNDEAADGGRTKSRRIRARESIADSLMQTDDVGFDQEKFYEDRLEEFAHADNWLFGTLGPLLSKIGVEELGTIDELKRKVLPFDDTKPAVESSQISPLDVDAVLSRDLRNALGSWNDEKARAALQADSSTTLQDFRSMNKSGLSIFLEHSRKSAITPGSKAFLSGNSRLLHFLRQVNERWLHLNDVAYAWSEGLLRPSDMKYSTSNESGSERDQSSLDSLYNTSLWSDTLKECVVQILIREDEHIFNCLTNHIDDLERRILSAAVNDSLFVYSGEDFSRMEMIQTIHELHLDVYALINNPNSEVDHLTRTQQKDRLARWGLLTRTAVNHFIEYGHDGQLKTYIGLRHLWSTTFHSNMAEDASREHIILCLQDLKSILTSLGSPVIALRNNAIMPEISVAALDQEISRLNSMDFFMKIFGSDSEDPLVLIESIEPILEPTMVKFVRDESSEEGIPSQHTAHYREMSDFLDRGDATLRLFLWRRLQDAYQSIDYLPKVVSCQLRSIETIMREIRGESFLELPADQRQVLLLRWLKALNDLLQKILPLILKRSEESFQCIDMDHLRSSLSAVVQLSRLLHSFALYEDAARIGQISPPEFRGQLSKTLETFKDKLRDMQIRCWVLQYGLLKECMAQESDQFDTPEDDRAHFLQAIHNAVGIRRACKYADRILLRLLKTELLTMQTEDDYEAEILQVLFDLHGFKLSTNDGTVDHGCTAEKIDRSTAGMMVDFLITQANRMSIKDLSKSDLKSAIDKVQHALNFTKDSNLSFNRRVISAYLKSAINPNQLSRAAQGLLDLSLMPVTTESAKMAKKGWYFLLGHASLMKIRGQKRLSPITTNELDVAITYFRQDLEHATDRWETWYRLGQTYDTKLEEDITWSADKINNNRGELATLQRNAIHCYAMAVSTALRSADEVPQTRAILSDLYTDFGMRIYGSSREPLSMSAFSLVDFTRHYSNVESQQMYKDKPFKELKLYSAWKFASFLFRKAMVDKPKYWVNHHMLGKCLWKMHNCDDSIRGNATPVGVDSVLDTLLDAIETLPQRRDSRSDPVFEPHFRFVSILHKLVLKRKIDVSDACKLLQETPWGKKVSPPENFEGWQPYILDILKNLKHADKSNWHHRILSRAAHVRFDESQDATAAAAAKNELMPQIFTKTMTVQVWKPEFERPGRHFVYTTRYVYFFVELLKKTEDRFNLDQLLRRIRKRAGDFIDHTKLWQDACQVQAELIRRAAKITEGHEEGVFKSVSWDEFVTNSARLEGWTQGSAAQSPIIDLLREAVELKKLNNNLTKVTMFEDLIADIYSRLYEMNVPRFIEQANEENRERMRVDHLLMAPDSTADGTTPPNSAAASDAPAPRGRTKGIARRDVQRRAETIVNRNLTSRGGTIGASATTTMGNNKTNEATATEENDADNDPTTVNTAGNSNKTPAVLVSRSITLKERIMEGGDGETPGAQSSVPASLHDSADDESELSEIDERLATLRDDESQKQALLLFPNLLSRKSPDPGSELSIQATSVDGDGDDNDGNEEENENEGETELEGGGEDLGIEAEEGDGEGGVDEARDVDMEYTEAPVEDEEEEGEGGADDPDDDQQEEDGGDQDEEQEEVDEEDDEDPGDDQEENNHGEISQFEGDNATDSKD